MDEVPRSMAMARVHAATVQRAVEHPAFEQEWSLMFTPSAAPAMLGKPCKATAPPALFSLSLSFFLVINQSINPPQT